jgi:hypothetical protein
MERADVLPDVGQRMGEEPVAALRRLFAPAPDATILAVLGRLLAEPPAIVLRGRDIENSAIYVWPAIAERNLSTLSVKEQQALAILVGSQEEAVRMTALGRWTWWRLAIGADGAWHGLTRSRGDADR